MALVRLKKLRQTSTYGSFPHEFLFGGKASALPLSGRIILLSFCLFLLSLPSHGQSNVLFRWQIPEPQLNDVLTSFEFDGKIQHAQNSRGLFVWIIGSTTAVFLADAVLRLHDSLDGGTLITINGQGITKIQRDRSIPGEMIVVIDKSGKPHWYERSAFSDTDQLATILGAD